ncbi:MAG: ribonuclease HI family protein [Firmicutes bacterium]|nr:ribonuclease HI family protein [Bacillota bacterium]NPV30298.1 ribonuclease HI family protein [Bacillota bacterium]
MVFYIDGASRGNPGRAGAGVVVCNEAGQIIKERKEYLGKATNNVAEYRALLLALQEALAQGATQVEVYTDSELLARQWNGEYRVRSPHLAPLVQQARSLSRAFSSCKLSHIPRTQNRRADLLANRAIDESSTPEG